MVFQPSIHLKLVVWSCRNWITIWKYIELYGETLLLSFKPSFLTVFSFEFCSPRRGVCHHEVAKIGGGTTTCLRQVASLGTRRRCRASASLLDLLGDSQRGIKPYFICFRFSPHFLKNGGCKTELTNMSTNHNVSVFVS